MSKQVPVKATKQTMEIVETLARHEGMSISEVASHMDMPKSTAYDYLQTLQELGYFVHADDGYRLSTRFLDLGTRRRLQMDVYTTAKPELKRLADETGEHATLVVEEQNMGILLATVMGENAVEVVANDGTRTYLHTTAPGKAILAQIPRERISQILDYYENDQLPSFASQTITERDELLEELDKIKKRGYASEVNEAIDGMRGVGVPIIHQYDDYVVGAISVYAPLNRTTSTEFDEEIPDLLLQATNVIELNLSYS